MLTPPAALSDRHDLSRFDCGNPSLDAWLRERALDSEGKTARTYVICESDVVVGYYCIAAGSVGRQELPNPLKRARGTPNQVPVAIVGRLARDLRYAGKGLGPDLLRDALARIVAASDTIGVRAVLVHAVDDRSAAFYRTHGFIEWPVDSRTLFLPIETLIRSLDGQR